MTNAERELIELSRASRVAVTKVPAGVASAPATRRAPAYDAGRAVSFVVDHCGREHAKNTEGEWLY